MTKDGFMERFGEIPRKDDITILAPKREDPTEQARICCPCWVDTGGPALANSAAVGFDQDHAGAPSPSAVSLRHGLVFEIGSPRPDSATANPRAPQSACRARDLCAAVSPGIHSALHMSNKQPKTLHPSTMPACEAARPQTHACAGFAQIFVFFPDDVKVGMKHIRTLAERMRSEGVQRAIMVAPVRCDCKL